jgi:Skp family chaperone for outer membrane proteins
MKNRMNLSKVLSIAVLGGLLFVGCQPAQSPKISVGKVDTAALLQDDPDYQSLSIRYIKEQTDIRKAFVDKLKAAGDSKDQVAKLQEEYMKAQIEFDEKWKKDTEDFLKSRHESIKATASEIAKRKKIDMVVIDSKKYPTVEWGGVDMTKDMALAMSSEDRPAASPSSSPSPRGDKD